MPKNGARKNDYRQPYQVMFSEYLDKLRVIDIERKTLDASVYMHWHEFCELELVIAGGGVHKFNNQVVPFRRGSLFLQLPTDFHEVLVDESDLPQLYSVKFSETFIEPAIFQEVLGNIRQRQVLLNEREYQSIARDFEQLYEEFIGDSLFREHVMKLLVEKIVISLERLASKAQSQEAGESNLGSHVNIIRESLAYIQKNYGRPISLQEIAAKANMSPNYFSAYFRENVGCTFRDYLRNVRMRYSISYLANFDLPVYKISEMAGYNNYEHFERTFQREFGVSPRTFRDMTREKLQKAIREANRIPKWGYFKMLSSDPFSPFFSEVQPEPID